MARIVGVGIGGVGIESREGPRWNLPKVEPIRKGPRGWFGVLCDSAILVGNHWFTVRVPFR